MVNFALVYVYLIFIICYVNFSAMKHCFLHLMMCFFLQNIAEKIISFAEEGPKHLCILSVNGSVSSATLLRPSTAGGVVTYEVQYKLYNLMNDVYFVTSTNIYIYIFYKEHSIVY